MPRRIFSCFAKPPSGNDRIAAADVAAASAEDDHPRGGGGAVLVELFSSQGCATSPAAELVLSRLGRGDFDGPGQPGVVVLAHHVDYWDYMGWKDPFGSSQATVRQKAYVETLRLDTLFTPQVVVRGRAHCVGNDEEALLALIRDAPRYAAPTFQATFQKPTLETLQVALTGALRMKVDSNGVNVMVALYESGLVTDCPAGENKDRILSNDFVVRRLEKLSFLKDVSAKKTVSGTVSFALWPTFNPTKCSVAVFVENRSHQIFGSQNIDLPNSL